ncbi:MAG: dockerin type I domain-containing protein [Bryobacteraceae bacterium]
MRVIQPSQDNQTLLQFDMKNGAYTHTRDVYEPPTGNRYHYVGSGSIPVDWTEVGPAACGVEPLVIQQNSLSDYVCETVQAVSPGPPTGGALMETIGVSIPANYSVDLKVKGGVQPYTYQVTGNFPAFLQVTGGRIATVPFAPNPCPKGKFSFKVIVRDSIGAEESMDYTLKSNPPRYIPLSDKPIYYGTTAAYTIPAILLFGFSGSPQCIAVPGCPSVAFAVGGMLVEQAIDFLNIALDPPDPNYSIPTTLRLYPVPTTSLAPIVNGHVQNLLNNASHSSAHSEALLRALERSMGAYDAGDNNWFDTQNAAAATFVRALVSFQQAQPRLASAWINSWKAAGLPSIRVTEQAVVQFQQQLLASGLPPEIEQLLRQRGVDSTGINNAVTLLRSVQPATATGVVPDVIATALQQAVTGIVPTLINYAKSFPVVVVAGDANRDGLVNCSDVALVRGAFGKQAGMAGFLVGADINADGIVDIRDLAFVSQRLTGGTQCQ